MNFLSLALLGLSFSFSCSSAWASPELLQAIEENNFPAIEERIEKKEHLTPSSFYPGSRGRSALTHAVIKRNTKAVELLLQAGADKDYADQDDHLMTALMYAALLDTNLFYRLINAGASLAPRNKVGYNATQILHDRLWNSFKTMEEFMGSKESINTAEWVRLNERDLLRVLKKGLTYELRDDLHDLILSYLSGA